MLNSSAAASSVTNRAKGCRVGDLWTIFDSEILRDEILGKLCHSSVDVGNIYLTLFFWVFFCDRPFCLSDYGGGCFYVSNYNKVELHH